MSIGIPPLTPIPGHSNLLIQIVPNNNRYHYRLKGFWELFRHEETGNVSIGKEDFVSVSELLRSIETMLTRELRKNKPAPITIRTLFIEYLSNLFPDDRDEISEDVRDTNVLILQDVQGIGPKVADELRKHGIADVQQLARAPEEVLHQFIVRLDHGIGANQRHSKRLFSVFHRQEFLLGEGVLVNAFVVRISFPCSVGREQENEWF